jgi:tetraacyldisaccharide 4'-kinase
MKTPPFWYQPPGLFSTLLQPVAFIYGQGAKIMSYLKKPQRFPIPILSVGNIVCGGSGKTPTAIALAQLLKGKGINVHFVTRGYGGRSTGPLQVDCAFHHPSDVGDEPLLLAQHAPTWVAKDRPLAVQKAIEAGAELIILDDGHQTSSLYKDLSFVVVDSLQGFGNQCVLPAGPLRENIDTGLKRTDALIGIGEKEMDMGKPLFKAEIIPQNIVIARNAKDKLGGSHRVIAFCGLGFPEKFYTTLKTIGVDLVFTKSFPDHYTYTEEDLLILHDLAKEHQAILVTTRKDLVKIPPSWQGSLHVLDINIQFEDTDGIYRFIVEKIPSLKEGT